MRDIIIARSNPGPVCVCVSWMSSLTPKSTVQLFRDHTAGFSAAATASAAIAALTLTESQGEKGEKGSANINLTSECFMWLKSCMSEEHGRGNPALNRSNCPRLLVKTCPGAEHQTVVQALHLDRAYFQHA